MTNPDKKIIEEFRKNTEKQFPEGKYCFHLTLEKKAMLMTINDPLPLSEALKIAKLHARELNGRIDWIVDNNAVRHILGDYMKQILQALASQRKEIVEMIKGAQILADKEQAFETDLCLQEIINKLKD